MKQLKLSQVTEGEGTMEIDKNNLLDTSAFSWLFKKLTVELTGEVSLIRSGAQFPPAGKY